MNAVDPRTLAVPLPLAADPAPTISGGGGGPVTSSSSSSLAPSSSSSSSSSVESQYYQIKYIDFMGRQSAILLQNENGPCPLLAIANILLLQGKIQISHPSVQRPSIDLQSLIAIVTEKILETATSNDTDSPELQKQKQVQLESVLKVIPRLQYGLDVNVMFSGVTGFEFTEELTIFDALGIGLYHGWILDPQDPNYDLISNKSYNHLVYQLVEYQSASVPGEDAAANAMRGSSTSSTYVENEKTEEDLDLVKVEYCDAIDECQGEEKENGVQKEEVSANINMSIDRKISEGVIIDTFLRESSSQLTYYGLMALYEKVKDKELCVFFRNNHFCTMFRKHDRLYLLVTDTGYSAHSQVVWELMDEIDGNTNFVNAQFLESSSTISSSSIENPLDPSQTVNPELVERMRREEMYYSMQRQGSEESVQSVEGESDEDFAKRLQAAQYSYMGQQIPPRVPVSSASSSQPYRRNQNRNQRMNRMVVIIPNGVRPGQKFLVNNPQGDRMEVICPNGSYAGDEITVEFPDRPTATPKRDKKDCILC